jgi:hypothetical protein
MAMEIDWNLIMMGLGNLGTIVWVAQRTITKVDAHGEIIPHLTSIAEEMKSHLPVLYDRDNELDNRVTMLEQTHQVLGCGAPEAKTRRASVRKRRKP